MFALAAQTDETVRPGSDDLPLFVVERSRVIWPERCEVTQSQVPPKTLSRIRQSLGGAGLLLSSGRVEEVAFGAPECMPGECGSGQFAIPLRTSGPEQAGILVRPSSFDGGSIHPLRVIVQQGAGDASPQGETAPQCEVQPVARGAGRSSADTTQTPVTDCDTYAEASGPLGVQVQGNGKREVTDWPNYEFVRFRMLKRRDGEWVKGPWHTQSRGKGPSLPVPVAVILGGTVPRVLWVVHAGICCPSNASAWITDVGKTARDGPLHIAGFGQPCD